MFAPNEQPAGSNYTATAALLIFAFIFIPALLIVSRPFGFASLSAAVACAVICIVMAWINRVKSPRPRLFLIAKQKTGITK